MRLVRNVMNAKGSKASLDSLAHKVQSLQQLVSGLIFKMFLFRKLRIVIMNIEVFLFRLYLPVRFLDEADTSGAFQS